MRRLLVAALACGVFFTLSREAEAAFEIRATEISGAGAVQFTKTFSVATGPGTPVVVVFTGFLGDFNVSLVSNTSTTGPGFSSHDTTIAVTYAGPVGASGTSDKLIVEFLGTAYMNPTAPAASQISSNASLSSNSLSGADVDSIVMTSGVVSGATVGFGAAGTTLGGQFGMTTGSSANTAGSSVDLLPDPALSAAPFAIFNPFGFYQTYTYDGFTKAGTVTISAASAVQEAVPAPAGLVLVIAGLPVLGGYCWVVRRRKAFQLA